MIRAIHEVDYPRLAEIWESAVLHTHDFLTKEDFQYYKERLPLYFQYVTLYGYKRDNELIGFIGVAEGNIEMLFVHNDSRGTGAGKELILYAIQHLGATGVDVNEQNAQAVGFYKHMGFLTVDRSELDGDGKAYPLLHMRLSAER